MEIKGESDEILAKIAISTRNAVHEDKVEEFLPKLLYKATLICVSEEGMISSLEKLAARMRSGEHPVHITDLVESEKEGLFFAANDILFVEIRQVSRMKKSLMQIAEGDLSSALCAEIAQKTLGMHKGE